MHQIHGGVFEATSLEQASVGNRRLLNRCIFCEPSAEYRSRSSRLVGHVTFAAATVAASCTTNDQRDCLCGR
jgi:hypothetical protein